LRADLRGGQSAVRLPAGRREAPCPDGRDDASLRSGGRARRRRGGAPPAGARPRDGALTASTAYRLMAGMAARVGGSKYELRRKVGHGGRGVVWEAYGQVLRRLVALKLRPQGHVASAEGLARFKREAMALAQVKNDHIVQIHGYGIDEGSPYIVMELLHGE